MPRILGSKEGGDPSPAPTAREEEEEDEEEDILGLLETLPLRLPDVDGLIARAVGKQIRAARADSTMVDPLRMLGGNSSSSSSSGSPAYREGGGSKRKECCADKGCGGRGSPCAVDNELLEQFGWEKTPPKRQRLLRMLTNARRDARLSASSGAVGGTAALVSARHKVDFLEGQMKKLYSESSDEFDKAGWSKILLSLLF